MRCRKALASRRRWIFVNWGFSSVVLGSSLLCRRGYLSPRRASADFSWPVFTAIAFYLCAKRQKLKVDKVKLIEVSTSMKDLCFDVFGITKEKKDPKAVKGHRELLDALPGKRKYEDDGDVSEDSIDDEWMKMDLSYLYQSRS